MVYTAGVRHAHNVAAAFQDQGIKAVAVSGETPKRELTRTLAAYERGEIDVLCNAQLLAEGWNSPRATVCMHLAPTASRRIYQQRVGRVTRRQPGKEAGIVVDFVHPATTNDDPVVTLHSLLDRDVYRGGAIVVGPVRRGRGRRLRVERRVLPVTASEERRAQVFERELWRIAVEHLSWGEQHAWAALAGRARVVQQLAPGEGDAALRQHRRAAPPLPGHLPAAQPQHPAAPARADRGRPAQGPRGVRRGGRAGGRLVPRRAPRGREGAAAGHGREAARPPRSGGTLDLAPGRVLARGARGVRRVALARDEAAAGPAGELLRRRPRAQRAPAGAGVQEAGPAAVRRAAGRRAGAHARGPAGAGRRPHADGAQAQRPGPRAVQELPQGPASSWRPSQARARQGQAADDGGGGSQVDAKAPTQKARATRQGRSDQERDAA